MTDRSVEAINAEIAKLKEQADSLGTQTTGAAPSQLDAVARAAYDDSQLLALAVLGLGVFVLCCITYLLRVDKPADTLLRPFATILVVVAAVFLIVAGYSEKQIAPVIGLLGTIAGYILGREDRPRPIPPARKAANGDG